MKELIEALQKHIKKIKDDANGALSKLPPVDQIAGGNEVIAALNCLRWSEAEIVRLMSLADEISTKYPSAIAAEIQKDLDAKVAAGELVSKTVMDAAVVAAESKGKSEAEAGFAAEKAALKLAGERRQEIETLYGAKAAACLPDEILAGDGFDAVKAEFGRRVTALSDVGISAAAQEETFKGMVAAGAYDAEGGKTFDSMVNTVRTVAGLKPGQKLAAAAPTPKGGSGSAAAQRQPAVAGPGGSESDSAKPKKVSAMF